MTKPNISKMDDEALEGYKQRLGEEIAAIRAQRLEVAIEQDRRAAVAKADAILADMTPEQRAALVERAQTITVPASVVNEVLGKPE